MVLLDALARWASGQGTAEAARAGDDAALRDGNAPHVGALVAIHIHHGLAEAADDWLAFCAREAGARGYVFEAKHVTVPRNARQGIEGAARAARYAALAEACAAHRVDLILSAHHADDQAETVLLQMLRGAGLAGVAAMAQHGPMPGVQVAAGQHVHAAPALSLLRPLLRVPRDVLQAYAEARELAWVEDPSNDDRRYLRNALRHDVLPAIAEHVPAYRETLGRFARHAAQAQSLLDQLAAIDFDAAHLGQSRLRRSTVQALDVTRLANLLRYWAAREHLSMPPEARLDEWLKQIREAGPQASLTLPHGDAVLRLYRDALQWTPVYASADPGDAADDVTLKWNGEREWWLPAWQGRLVFERVALAMGDIGAGAPKGSGDAEAPACKDGRDGEVVAFISEAQLRAAPLIARERAGGERWRAHADGHSRSLKHWFQARGVPAWRRHVPIVWQGERIVFVPHLGLDGGAAVTMAMQASPLSNTPGVTAEDASTSALAVVGNAPTACWRMRWQDDA